MNIYKINNNFLKYNYLHIFVHGNSCLSSICRSKNISMLTNFNISQGTKNRTRLSYCIKVSELSRWRVVVSIARGSHGSVRKSILVMSHHLGYEVR